MNRKNNQKPITALYCRLSLEDGKDNESMSISNQKAMLAAYADSHGLFDHAFYVDDGYTGRNFNRPGFQQMIADIEDGKVGCVITKDLSRLGRNYIEAGSYIEIYFPKHNVRYIAINDNVDTITGQELDITPFKNILNDMYSRDISKKVLTGWMARSRQGKFVGGTPPYGLMRDPNDKGHLIIDPETAPTVRLIFELAASGYGRMRIAKQLMEKKIPITRVRPGNTCDVNYYYWGSSRIGAILRNPIYYGAHVVCKTHQKAIRSNTYNIIPREEREIIEGCHEAIVSKELFEQVQRIIDQRPEIMKGNACPYHNIFRGIIFCGTCGKSMQVRYEKQGRKDTNRTTKQIREPIDKTYFICQTYNRTGVGSCSSHKIEARALHEAVLNDIQGLVKEVMEDESAFYDRLAVKLAHRHSGDVAQLQKEITALKARIAEIDELYMKLYEDKAKGVITESRFVMMTGKLDTEQAEARELIQQHMEALNEEDSKSQDIQLFVNELLRFAAITELDEIVTHRLIEKIVIGEPYEEDGETIQKIQIVYNFVGAITE